MSTNDEARGILREVHRDLLSLNDRILADSVDKPVCSGFATYYQSAPGAYLERAIQLLNKNFYRVGLAGGFSGGKSTLINALLSEPGLLPVAPDECTMSITVVSAPKSGQQERVEVDYFTKDEALRNVFQNMRYHDVLGDVREEVLDNFSADKACDVLQQQAIRSEDNAHIRQKQAELQEFIDYLRKKEEAGHLGHVRIDDMNSSSQYLTVDSQGKGMGHLLLIRLVHIFRNNPLFIESGIEIIDLPGTDSINERQRELTHAYLEEADVVISVLEPRGFSEADKRIEKKFREFNLQVRNKMFFVINKFDQLEGDDLKPEKLGRLLQEQVVGEIVRSGMRPERLYLTSAKWEEMVAKKGKGTLSDEETALLDSFLARGRANLNRDYGYLPPDMQSRLKHVYTDSGVNHLRVELIDYLQNDIQTERLREVTGYLTEVVEQLEAMVGPERAGVEDIIEKARNKIRRVGEFIEGVGFQTQDLLGEVIDKLPEVVPALVSNAKEQLAAGIDKLLDSDNRYINIRQIRSGLTVPQPHRIMEETVAKTKEVLGDKFIEIMEECTVSPVLSKVRDQLNTCRNEEILERLSDQTGGDFVERYRNLLETLDRDTRQFTRRRALEEVWSFLDTQLQPRPPQGTGWNDAVEAEFRENLKKTCGEMLSERANTLSAVLWKYYRSILNDFVTSFADLMSNVLESIRFADVALPMELLEGAADENTAKKYKIVDYITGCEASKESLDKVSAMLGEGPVATTAGAR